MSARDKKIVIVLLGVIVVALAYFFGHRPLTEKRATLEAENASLRDTYADLSMKAANADMYQKEIKIMNTKIEEIFTHYPSYLQIENGIMDAVALEEVTESTIPSLTISDPVAVAVGTEQAAPAEDGSEAPATPELPYQLYDINSTISFQSGYAGMKKLIDVIANDTKRKSVGTLSVTFDASSGKVSGSMVYDTYFVYGLDKPYVEPSVPSIKHGTPNIFGTIDTVGQ